jgi:hypothetical protein
MRNVWIGSVAAMALACTAALGAQATASPASSNQTGQNTITVTGCLKPADAMGGATGTSGTATPGTSSTAGAGGSDRFMLANATTGAAPRTGTAETPATGTTPGTPRTGTASSSMNASSSSYVLEGNASQLRPHLNHQVEITGRLDSSASTGSTARPGTATPTTAGGTTPSPATGSEAHPSAAKTLRVESVKMIAATCPAS